MAKKKKQYKRYDPNVNDGSKKPIQERVVTVDVNDKFSQYPSNGLTPQRLASIFRAADSGDVESQMELFEEMEEKDTHLFSQLQTRKNAVTGLEWDIQPFSTNDPRDKEIAEFVKDQLSSIDNLDEIFIDLLDAIGKGISFSEIQWGFDEGHYIVEDIQWVHPKKVFWDSMTDEIKIRTREFPQGIELPDNKFIIHKYKARSGHPSRAGILRVVAWMYLFKNYDIKDWVSFCEVFGMPLRLGTYSPSASEADKEALARAIIQIGTDAAGIIPEGTTIEFKEASKTTSINVYETLARYCDEQMSKAILGQTLTSDSGGGSFAQGKVHNDVRHDLTVADCRALSTTLRRDLIKPLVFFNFGEDKRIPKMKFECEEAEDLKELANILDILIGKIGLKIPTSYIYKKFSIPIPENGEEVAAPITNVPTDSMAAMKYLALKDKDEKKQAQKKVDEVADLATKNSEAIFDELLKPVMDLIENTESLEDIKKLIDDETEVKKLFAKMNNNKLDDLLEKGMYISNVVGRSVE